ncbi:MAG: NAD(P)(+) transhydrogenase (Re/Si-specific) subunit beta, partial [Spirochaetaceae bacterium]|nr:NAD(P)(+) transhydrogenase (Re/Si-specific) subunit beta [Spirochaetaceae bacterium]
LNGFGGGASLLVAGAALIEAAGGAGAATQAASLQFAVAISAAGIIGAVTFFGSMIAFGKLQGILPGRPIMFPGQKALNGLLILAAIVMTVLLVLDPTNTMYFLIMTAITFVLGIHLVMAIGGADMPVVITLLNSYSGLAACATGFVLNNYGLIIAGSLVGASGMILTNIMCKAMNRSLANVLFSGFGSGGGSRQGAGFTGEAKPVSIEDAYPILEAAQNILIVPGYGMAVAQAQHAVQELASLLKENGAEVNFGIHPVAGRMPGHMNVLLAEANVPYDQLREMDDVNPTIEMVDVALVIGANDVVNPAARTDEGSPLYGMPVINVDKAHTVIVFKRSLNPGFAGVDNPLFFGENTRMLFGDAKHSMQGLVAEFKD